jgi:ABC-type sugar transport system ATPase subunit
MHMARVELRGVEKWYGGTRVFEDIDLDVLDGEFMVILGPSGCGKSTLLRVIAGIEDLTGGSVWIGDQDVTTKHPGDRDVAMVFQDYALYPHMTVEQNLNFGLRAKRVPKATIKEKVEHTSSTLGIDGLLHRKPAQLSGGQRQRVALGRAMIRDPHAYLMDEPLSNLDAALRVQMRAELIDFHRRTHGTVLYVTHDQVEAMTMGERIAVMNEGRFEQLGEAQEVYNRPRNTFVATFLGSPRMNLLPGRLEVDRGNVTVTSGDLRWQFPRSESSPQSSRDVQVGFRPESIAVVDDVPDGSCPDAAALFHRPIDFTEQLGYEVILYLAPQDGSERRLVARLSNAELEHARASTAYLVSLQEIHVFEVGGDVLFHGSDVELPAQVRHGGVDAHQ